MEFQSIYNKFNYQGESNNGQLHVTPNEALSPKQILQRFVRDMPLEATSQGLEVANDDLDNEVYPMQGQEYDPLEERDKLMEAEMTLP